MNNIEKDNKEDDIFARISFAKIIKYWYLYVIFLFLALVMAFFYQRYQKPVYEAYTTMFIKGRQMDLNQMNIISGIGGGNFVANDITKELTILQSYAMKERTLKNLDFTITYLRDYKYNSYDIYKNNPFVVEIDKSQPQMTGTKYELEIIDDETFTLSTESDVINMFDLENNVQVAIAKNLSNFREHTSLISGLTTNTTKYVSVKPINSQKKRRNQNLVSS